MQPLGAVYLEHHPYPSDIFWLIDFSKATLSYDLTVKRSIYAKAGISEYWVVNLNDNELKVFRDLEQSHYTREDTHTTGTISPRSFADIEISVQRLLKP